jgi:hypothetical protein
MSDADWYARKMGAPKPPVSTPPSAPAQPVPYRWQPGQDNVPVNYDPALDNAMQKSQAAKESENCPECRSGNYMAPMGTKLKRCYDCGYPLRQSGSGVGGVQGQNGGTVIPAKQVGQSGGFQPHTIIDRIG